MWCVLCVCVCVCDWLQHCNASQTWMCMESFINNITTVNRRLNRWISNQPTNQPSIQICLTTLFLSFLPYKLPTDIDVCCCCCLLQKSCCGWYCSYFYQLTFCLLIQDIVKRTIDISNQFKKRSSSKLLHVERWMTWHILRDNKRQDLLLSIFIHNLFFMRFFVV